MVGASGGSLSGKMKFGDRGVMRANSRRGHGAGSRAGRAIWRVMRGTKSRSNHATDLSDLW